MRLTWRVSEVARMLGVSDYTIRRHIQRHRLPAAKLGGAVLIRQTDLEEFVASFPEAVPKVCPAPYLRRVANRTVSLERARALRETARRG